MNNNVQDPSQLCANDCGFFANPSLRNLCSSCYRDYLNKTLLEIERKSSHNNKQQTVVDSSDKKDASTTTRTRCDACKKRVGLIGFKCRCGGVYCGLHRYANEHSCAVDNIHKALEREALSKQLNAAACKADKFSCRI